MINQVSAGTAPGPAVSGGAGGVMGKDEFLKLFVTQLRHQDPLNPMNPDQLASQLAQFSSVEQLMNIGAQLEAMAATDAQIAAMLGAGNAIGTLGRTVVALGDELALPDASEVRANVGSAGGTATLKIYDAGGRLVGERPLGSVRGGTQSFELGSAASGLPPGKYSYAIEVVDAAGNPVPVQPYVVGRVESIRHSPQGPLLIAGGIEIPLVHVVEVLDR
jgi:flagellar basal-body rod modification protein FlgD